MTTVIARTILLAIILQLSIAGLSFGAVSSSIDAFGRVTFAGVPASSTIQKEGITIATGITGTWTDNRPQKNYHHVSTSATSYSFSGVEFAIRGTMTWGVLNWNVSIDGVVHNVQQDFSGLRGGSKTNQILWGISGLSPGTHNVSIAINSGSYSLSNLSGYDYSDISIPFGNPITYNIVGTDYVVSPRPDRTAAAQSWVNRFVAGYNAQNYFGGNSFLDSFYVDPTDGPGNVFLMEYIAAVAGAYELTGDSRLPGIAAQMFDRLLALSDNATGRLGYNASNWGLFDIVEDGRIVYSLWYAHKVFGDSTRNYIGQAFKLGNYFLTGWAKDGSNHWYDMHNGTHNLAQPASDQWTAAALGCALLYSDPTTTLYHNASLKQLALDNASWAVALQGISSNGEIYYSAYSQVANRLYGSFEWQHLKYLRDNLGFTATNLDKVESWLSNLPITEPYFWMDNYYGFVQPTGAYQRILVGLDPGEDFKDLFFSAAFDDFNLETDTNNPDYNMTGFNASTAAFDPLGLTYQVFGTQLYKAVSATFAQNQYPLSTSAGTGGSISPASRLVSYGSTTTFTVTPTTGYSIDSVTGCGGTLSGSSYTTGPITAACTISATFARNQYPLSTSAGTGGSISPASRLVSYGSTTTFTVTPTTGYSIDSVTGCGGTLSGSSYTTGPITAACTISATFARNQYPLSTSAGTGGSISPASRLVSYGSTTTFTVTPTTGYSIDSVTGCGGTLSGSSYTTGPITAACTISATFAQNQYPLSTSAGTGGSISPASRLVSYGSTTTFTVTPTTGYSIDSVTGCGGTLSGSTYTTGPITAACTISATFAQNQYSITASAGLGGTVSPMSVLVSYGSVTIFIVTPNIGYRIDTVTGCNGSLSGVIYSTSLITGPCTVMASFKLENRAATTPTLNSPLSSSETTTTTPTLSVNASTDPDGDPVTYMFELYSDSGLSTLVAVATTSNTSWTVPSLTDNTLYYWRALASDGLLLSPWMPTANFFVNTVNDPPTSPSVSSPANNTNVGSLTPVLSVTNATDVDIYDTITYDFDVSTDGSFANIVASIVGAPQGTGGITSWTVIPALSEDTPYYWRARAKDNHGATSNWVSTSFFVNTTNHPPTAPTLNGPVNAGTVATFTPTLTINNSVDPDRDPLMYVFEVDTANTFDSANKQSSGLVAEGSAVATWVPSILTEDTTYYWRAKANDGLTDGPWMAPASFFVNTVNEPPTVPTLNNPANGSQVTVLAPTLTVNASTDPDHDAITYEFEIYSNSGLTSMVTSTTGAGINWIVDKNLSDNTWYWWRAQARDIHGLASGWMTANSFVVNDKGYNDPPSITLTKPTAAEPPTNALTYMITWIAADPDSDPVISLYYDTTGSGYNGTLIATGMHLSDPVSSYTWDISGLADGTYYVYAKIDDGTTAVYAYASGPLVISRTVYLTINATAGTGGSITPSGAISVVTGATQTFTIPPNSGYRIQSVFADGVDQGPITSYAFQNVTASHTINATFAVITYTITAIAGLNGTIMPSGTLTVNQGDNAAFTITPNSGYQVQSVLVDGVNKGAITNYTFVSVIANHSISASFALIEADTTPPTGTIAINGGAAYTTSKTVTLTLSCDNNDCTEIRLSNDTVTWTTASYATSRNWQLAAGNGVRSVYVRYSDAASNWSEVYSGIIIYDDTAPTNGTLSATASPGTIALTWAGFSDAVSGLSSYTLVYSMKSTPSSCSIGTVLYSGPGTSYTHTGVAPGTTYNYRLCATDSAGNVSKGITTKVKAP